MFNCGHWVLTTLGAWLFKVNTHFGNLLHFLLSLVLLLQGSSLNQGSWDHTCVHLAEKESQNTFAILPLQIVQINLLSSIWILLIIICLRLLAMLTHLLLNLGFLPDFLFDLFKRFQEKLLHLWPLVQNNLSQSFNLLEFRVLASQHFTSVQDVLALLLDNWFVLETNHFFLFFKIANNLLEGLFEDWNLLLVGWNFLVLLVLAADVFLFRALVYVYVTL